MLNYFALSGLINFAVSIIGIIVVLSYLKYLKKEKILYWLKKNNKVFGALSIAVAIWSFGYFQWHSSNEYSKALFWLQISNIGATLIPIFYLYWASRVVGSFFNKNILRIGYFAVIIFLLFNFSPLFIKEIVPIKQFPFWPQPGILYHFYILFYVFSVIYSLYCLFKKYKYTKTYFGYNEEDQKHTKYIIWGTIIGFGGGATNFFLFYQIPIAPYLNILAAMGLGIFIYSVNTYNKNLIKFREEIRQAETTKWEQMKKAMEEATRKIKAAYQMNILLIDFLKKTKNHFFKKVG